MASGRQWRRGWTTNYLSLWRVLCFLYVLCIPHAVSLHNATLARSMLISMPAGDASHQTTPVQIMQVKFMCCVVLHKLRMHNFDSCKSLSYMLHGQADNNLICFSK